MQNECDRDAPEDQLKRRVVAEPGQDRVELNADLGEDEGVEQKDDGYPEAREHLARARLQHRRRKAADDQTRRDGCEHARLAEIVRRQVRDERHDDRDRRLQRLVFERAPGKVCEPGRRQTDQHRYDELFCERAGGVPKRERRADDRGDADRIQNERRRVVDEALAFDRSDDVPRDVELVGDRREGDLVGRSDDGAEDERHAPRHAGDDRVGDDRDGNRGEDDQAKGHLEDPERTGAELASRRGYALPIEQGREKDDEHEVRRQRNRRHARDETDRHSAEHENDRIGDVDAIRDRDQHDDRKKDNDDCRHVKPRAS